MRARIRRFVKPSDEAPPGRGHGRQAEVVPVGVGQGSAEDPQVIGVAHEPVTACPQLPAHRVDQRPRRRLVRDVRTSVGLKVSRYRLSPSMYYRISPGRKLVLRGFRLIAGLWSRRYL